MIAGRLHDRNGALLLWPLGAGVLRDGGHVLRSTVNRGARSAHVADETLEAEDSPRSRAAARRSTTRRTREQGKLFARERIALLARRRLVRRGRALANNLDAGAARRRRRHRHRHASTAAPSAIMANDSTVKAGLVGRAARSRRSCASRRPRSDLRVPALLPRRLGRRAHHRSGRDVPGPARRGPHLLQPGAAVRAGAADLPALRAVARRAARTSRRSATSSSWSTATRACTSARRAWPRWSSARRSRSRRWAARRCTARVSGCGDVLVEDRGGGDRVRRSATSRYMPQNCDERAAASRAARAPKRSGKPLEEIIPADENKPFDMMRGHRRELIDEGSFVRDQEALRARRSSPASRASTGARSASSRTSRSTRAACCSSTSADKAARFIWLCDAFNVPLLYLADVPGFMIGTKVERQGIIRAGAKMIAAVSEATVPEDQRHRAQGLRRGPLRDVRAGVRARRVPRAADGVDRGDGPAGRGERGLLQQDPGGPRRARARRATSRSCATSTARTSTSTKLASELVVDGVVPVDRLRAEIVAALREPRRGATRSAQAPRLADVNE